MNKKEKNFQLVVGVCKDNKDVIVDITYNNILNNLSEDDLKDVYCRLELLKRDVRKILHYTWWDRLKEVFYGLCNR